MFHLATLILKGKTQTGRLDQNGLHAKVNADDDGADHSRRS